MKKVNNKKGFTLVELLAVIVILALIMGIAIASMGGVIDNARRNTMKSTAASIINGVRNQVLAANLGTNAGTYEFTNSIVEKGGKTSPLGGDYVYATNSTGTLVGSGVYKITDKTLDDCTASSTSYVVATSNGNGGYTWSICLTAGANNVFVKATESNILASGSSQNVNIFSDLMDAGDE